MPVPGTSPATRTTAPIDAVRAQVRRARFPPLALLPIAPPTSPAAVGPAPARDRRVAVRPVSAGRTTRFRCARAVLTGW
ncbi:hypothetical protein GCM10010273_49520 [Streptomyces lavendulocolor]